MVHILQQETAAALERRAIALLGRGGAADHREVEQALDQLRADRANGEEIDEAIQRLTSALG